MPEHIANRAGEVINPARQEQLPASLEGDRLAANIAPSPSYGAETDELTLSTTIRAENIPTSRDSYAISAITLIGEDEFQFSLNPPIRRFLRTDDDGVTFDDYTDEVTDRNIATLAVLSALDTLANDGYLLVASPHPFGGLFVDIADANAVLSVLTAEYWDGAVWADLGAADGTDDTGATFGQDGLVTWVTPADWAQQTIDGFTGYFARLSVSAALTDPTTIRQVVPLNRDGSSAVVPAGTPITIGINSDTGAIQGRVVAGSASMTATYWFGSGPQIGGGNVVTGPLTDTELRAAAVPVSGTFWPVTQPVSGTLTANGGTPPAVAWPTTDAGIAWASLWGVGNVPVTSADLTAVTDVTDSPSAGEHLVITDILCSTDTAMLLTFTEETSGTVIAHIRLAEHGTAQVTFRGKRSLPVADRKLRCQASAAGNVEILVGYYSEA